MRHSRTSGRRKSSVAPDLKWKAAAKRRSNKAEKEILQLVRSGVERFILKNDTVEDFLRTIRAVGGDSKAYSHQLTRSVFSRIVKEAIRKRKRRSSKQESL